MTESFVVVVNFFYESIAISRRSHLWCGLRYFFNECAPILTVLLLGFCLYRFLLFALFLLALFLRLFLRNIPLP